MRGGGRRTSTVRAGGPALQAKLEVGRAGDRYEQEADRVSKLVMGDIRSAQSTTTGEGNGDGLLGPSGAEPIQRSAISGRIRPQTALPRIDSGISGPRIQAKAEVPMIGPEGGALDADTESRIRQSTGRPLDEQLRRSMEGGFGADFSQVRVHDDANAHDLNRRIQAKAFTTGSDIYFRSGEYEPSTPAGQELVAHELTHTIQQGGAPVRRELDDRATSWKSIDAEADRKRLAQAAEEYRAGGGAGGTGGAFDQSLTATPEQRAATEARIAQQKKTVETTNDLPPVFWRVYESDPEFAIREFRLSKAQVATLSARQAGKTGGMSNFDFFRGKQGWGKDEHDVAPEAMDARAQAKGKIASPQDLFSAKEIASHLSNFQNGAHAFVPVPASEAFIGKWQKWDGFHGWGAIRKENGAILDKDSNFVAPIDEANAANAKAHSEAGIETLENDLGIPGKAWSNSNGNPRKELMRWVIPKPKFDLDAETAGVVLRMATGREMGADPDLWVAGGFTKGGAREATLEAIPAEDLITLLAAGEIKQKIERYPETGDEIPKGSTVPVVGKQPERGLDPTTDVGS